VPVGVGGVCIANAQCTSSICGVTGSGHCCTATCAVNVGDPCTYVDCDGSGACKYASSTTSCASLGTSCTGTTLLMPTTCDGSGTCQMTNTSCAPYACSGTVCATSCFSNDNAGDVFCAAGYYCNGSACVKNQSTGASCHNGAMCTSGTCLGNNKCN
jgi:hypothetical protein